MSTTIDYRFEAKQSDDDLKQDLELTCTECGKHLCDIEDGDELLVLLGVAKEHMGQCPGKED